MADTKYSGLSAAASFLTTHEFGVNEAGTSKKVTGQQVMNAVAQGKVGYAEITATSATFTTSTDIAGLTFTTPVLVAGRRIRVTFYAQVTSSVTTDVIEAFIMEGATQLAQGLIPLTVAAGGHGVCYISTVLTPSAAAHTYKITCTRFAGTGNCQIDGASTNRAYILAEDIGT
jgi:hypothetical protein